MGVGFRRKRIRLGQNLSLPVRHLSTFLSQIGNPGTESVVARDDLAPQVQSFQQPPY